VISFFTALWFGITNSRQFNLQEFNLQVYAMAYLEELNYYTSDPTLPGPVDAGRSVFSLFM